MGACNRCVNAHVWQEIVKAGKEIIGADPLLFHAEAPGFFEKFSRGMSLYNF
jgi:hypothetical protein